VKKAPARLPPAHNAPQVTSQSQILDNIEIIEIDDSDESQESEGHLRQKLADFRYGSREASLCPPAIRRQNSAAASGSVLLEDPVSPCPELTKIAEPDICPLDSGPASDFAKPNKPAKAKRPAAYPCLSRFSDMRLKGLTQCVACELKWTARKTVAEKLKHISTCAKKRQLEDVTLSTLIVQQLEKAEEVSAMEKKKHPLTQPLPRTLLARVTEAEAPKRSGRKPTVTPTVVNPSHSRPKILGRARDLLGDKDPIPEPQRWTDSGKQLLSESRANPPPPADAPPSTQPFARSALATMQAPSLGQPRAPSSLFMGDYVMNTAPTFGEHLSQDKDAAQPRSLFTSASPGPSIKRLLQGNTQSTVPLKRACTGSSENIWEMRSSSPVIVGKDSRPASPAHGIPVRPSTNNSHGIGLNTQANSPISTSELSKRKQSAVDRPPSRSRLQDPDTFGEQPPPPLSGLSRPLVHPDPYNWDTYNDDMRENDVCLHWEPHPDTEAPKQDDIPDHIPTDLDPQHEEDVYLHWDPPPPPPPKYDADVDDDEDRPLSQLPRTSKTIGKIAAVTLDLDISPAAKKKKRKRKTTAVDEEELGLEHAHLEMKMLDLIRADEALHLRILRYEVGAPLVEWLVFEAHMIS
jgi:hypothetical protein